jgi:hypothetical protein
MEIDCSIRLTFLRKTVNKTYLLLLRRLIFTVAFRLDRGGGWKIVTWKDKSGGTINKRSRYHTGKLLAFCSGSRKVGCKLSHGAALTGGSLSLKLSRTGRCNSRT